MVRLDARFRVVCREIGGRRGTMSHQHFSRIPSVCCQAIGAARGSFVVDGDHLPTSRRVLLCLEVGPVYKFFSILLDVTQKTNLWYHQPCGTGSAWGRAQRSKLCSALTVMPFSSCMEPPPPSPPPKQDTRRYLPTCGPHEPTWTSGCDLTAWMRNATKIHVPQC